MAVYPLRTHRKHTWVSGIFWVLVVTIAYVLARFLYGYLPDTYLPKGNYLLGTPNQVQKSLKYPKIAKFTPEMTKILQKRTHSRT